MSAIETCRTAALGGHVERCEDCAHERAQRGGRRLRLEGLPDQRPRQAQDHDARRGRVHPPLSPARAAQRLPPHPPLRPVRWNGSSAQHRARPPIARRAQALVPERSRRGRQRRRNTFVCTAMPVLRRPDDHRRDLRRPRAPRVFPRQSRSGSTPHDDCRGASRLATPFLLPSGRAPKQQDAVFNSSHSFSKRRAHARPSQDTRQKSSSSSFPPPSIPAAKYPRRQVSPPPSIPAASHRSPTRASSAT